MNPQARWTVLNALQWTAGAFAKAGVEGARREAELLLGAATELSRVQLYAQYDRPLSDEERAKFRDFIKRRTAGEPVQYILGHQPFWTIDLCVDPRVLIPRADTEVLVEEVIAWARAEGAPGRPRIVDVGTGSGAIALSLAKELPNAEVWGIDISPGALEVARANAVRNGLEGQVRFEQGALLAPLTGSATPSAHVVVSNPPYIDDADMLKLPPHIFHHEPKLALAGGPDGLSVIHPLVAQARNAIEPGGLLVIEIGTPAQASQVAALVNNAGFCHVRTREDYARAPRAVVGHQPKSGLSNSK